MESHGNICENCAGEFSLLKSLAESNDLFSESDKILSDAVSGSDFGGEGRKGGFRAGGR